MYKPSLQFSITRIDKNMFHVIVQDHKEILRSYDIARHNFEIEMDFELNQLEPLGKSGV